MLRFKHLFLPSFLVFSFLSSCSGLKISDNDKNVSLPTKFEKFASDTSYSKPKWNEFYKDSFLLTLIETALKDNFDIQIINQKLEIASTNFRQSRWMQLPGLSLFAGYGRRKYGDYTIDGVGNFDTNLSPNVTPDKKIPDVIPDYSGGLQTSWEIDVWGKFRNMKRAARARFLATGQGRNFYKTMLVSQVAFSYYQLVALDRELEIVKNNIALQEKVLELVKAQKEGGLSNELAISQVKAQLLNTKAIEFEISQHIVEEEITLNQLLGRVQQPISRSNSITATFFNDSLVIGNPKDLVLNRPDVLEKEFELFASKADVNVARTAFLPSFSLVANVGVQSFNYSQLMALPTSLAYNAALGLVSPIFNRNEIRANFNIKKNQKVEALLAYQKSIVGGYSEILTHLYGIFNNSKVVDLRSQEVEILKQAIQYASDLYATGNANYIEVITVQRNVLLAELELVHSQKNVLFENIMLYKAIGGGWE